MLPRHLLPLLALVLTAAVAPSPAAAAVPPASFYSPADGSIPAAHGKLMRIERISGGSLPRNGKSFVVLYSSRAPSGEAVAVSGLVTLPKGPAPRGGFPVVSWAHGTEGIADSCAPSKYATNAPTSDYERDFRKQAMRWVNKGWVVAQTDYQGLGTPDLHPYLIGVAEGRSVIDIVSAVR
ncbi:MAG: lipase, partial [Solirubrobacteraceae bacterium]